MSRFVELPYVVGKYVSSIDMHTLLMLHGEDFTDSSSYNRSITNVGGVTIGEGKFDKGFYFTREKRLYTDLSVDDKMQLSDKDFTIDFWALFRDNISTNTIFTYSDQSTYQPLSMVLETIAGLKLFISNEAKNGYKFNVVAGKRPAYNAWNHYAIVRKKERLLFFMDGILISEIDIDDHSFNASSSLMIAHYTKSGSNTYGINGSIDELRISDVARWTSSFTPPTKPYA